MAKSSASPNTATRLSEISAKASVSAGRERNFVRRRTTFRARDRAPLGLRDAWDYGETLA